jgi:hypothetical protein
MNVVDNFYVKKERNGIERMSECGSNVTLDCSRIGAALPMQMPCRVLSVQYCSPDWLTDMRMQVSFGQATPSIRPYKTSTTFQ